MCEELRCRPSHLKAWREKGMPFVREGKGYRYDPHAVANWLLESGIATTDDEELDDDTGPVYRKRAEVAAVFGVHSRAVSSWLEEPSFPGRAGERSTARGGYFPARAIARWLRNNNKKAIIPAGLLEEDPPATLSTSINPRDRLANVRADKAEHELRRLQGALVSADEVKAYFQRTCNYANTALNEFPHRVLAALPHDVDERVKRVVFTIAQQEVKDTLLIMADLLERDPDDETD